MKRDRKTPARKVKGEGPEDMKRDSNTQRTTKSIRGQTPFDYYRGLGFSVFPVGENKRPYTSLLPRDEKGRPVWKPFQTRHATEDELNRWKKVRCNVGVATGSLSGIMVFDADSDEAIAELEALNPKEVKIPFVHTPRGGRHYYVKNDKSLSQNMTNKGKSKKIDLRGEGGFVLVPPGKTKNGRYEWDRKLNLRTTPIPTAPKKWLMFILHARLSATAGEAIEEGPKLIEGSRDVDIFRMACAMRREGWTRVQAEEMCVTMAQKARLKPHATPFTDQDARDKVKSAWSRPLRDTRRAAGNGEPLYFPISTIAPRTIEWLWYNRIPYGCYSAVGGDPGEGKSIVLTDICAKITRGSRLPDNAEADPSGSIMYMIAEDNMSDTVRIRAQDAGADLSKFIVSTGEKPDGGFFSIVNPDDLALFDEQITAQGDVRIAVFDPITTFLAGLRTADEVEVRAALAPLNRLAEKHRIGVIGVGHLNKDEAKKALYRLSGSIAFVAVARTVWLVKKEEGTDRRYFSPLKHNILKDPTTLSFKIIGPLGRPKVEWDDDPVDVECADLLGDEAMREQRSALNSARIFLHDFLPAGEERLQSEIMAEALGQGHKKKTMERAKNQLNIRSVQRERSWYWRRG